MKAQFSLGPWKAAQKAPSSILASMIMTEMDSLFDAPWMVDTAGHTAATSTQERQDTVIWPYFQTEISLQFSRRKAAMQARNRLTRMVAFAKNNSHSYSIFQQKKVNEAAL